MKIIIMYGACLTTLLFLLFPCRAQAHPHVWVDVSLAFSINDEGLESVRETWLFDEMFTGAVMGDLGLTPMTLETTLGQEKIRAGAFDFLANFDYFTFMEAQGKRIPVAGAEGFEAHFFDGRLVYGFTVPIHRPFSRLSGFRMAVFDKEYYADVHLLASAIGFEIDGMASVSHTVRPARDLAYWQFIVPDAVHLSLAGPSGRTGDLPGGAGDRDLGLMVDLMTRLRVLQKDLTLRLNRFGMDIRDNPFGASLWMFLALSFVYGIVHAVGPGHGKGVVCAYFMSNPGSFASAALMGNVITFVHMLSAVAVVVGAYFIVDAGMGGFQRASNIVQPVSYGLLTCMGLFLLVAALRRMFRGGPGPALACTPAGASSGKAHGLRNILAVSFVTGLIPCPGAAVILSFSIGLDILWAGVLAVAVMAMGMGVTTTAFGWAAVGTRKFTVKLSDRNRTVFRVAHSLLSVGGALAITLLGGLFFYGSLGYRWPGM